MENWNGMQTTANYIEHNNWYNNMFAANIKTEPGTLSSPTQIQQHATEPPSATTSAHLENYLKQQQQQQYLAMDTSMTTSSTNSHNLGNTVNNSSSEQQQQQFFDTAGMHQQLMQQQQYQQHFQQAQQAAAQNQASSHLPLGFNPLTPPGLPQAILPAMSHFYTQSTQQQRQQQQTPSPQPLVTSLLENPEKSALTPRHTPPMDITPPKSPKASNSVPLKEQQPDQELMSNCSEDPKFIADSDDDEALRLPIYNSHGKMKNYRCKTCGMVAITKLDFWDHAKIHMKPEKILQCPKCPFVTELKHHLEYHIRKHKNLKPFQCEKCSYSCVNKSMLNSHRKSHSSVYQYRCADCDYATKYCHSFKLHLRKYDHKPGMVLDEEGIPNPSVVIDVYGTRRGPKNKGSSGSSMKRSNTDLKITATSQLSAALQGFPHNPQNKIPASPAKSCSSVTSELPALTNNMTLQQQQQKALAAAQNSPAQHSQASNQNGNITNLFPPLASLLQQSQNMAFFPYFNLNLQMLAAHQQAAVMAQLSPHMREQLQKQQQQKEMNEHQQAQHEGEEDNDEGEDENQDFDRKSVDSAMDLSQGTPTKEDDQQQQTPELALNLKMAEDNVETPLVSSTTATRRKGRALKLDQRIQQLQSASNSPNDVNPSEILKDSSSTAPTTKLDSSSDETMETGNSTHNNPSNTSSTSTASSSGNSSNSSNTASSSATSTANSSPAATPTMYECKYCDIFFKDAVLYTIHMGYHSCDDVFKCNMCGEKCDGPIGLFVHMARNAHS